MEDHEKLQKSAASKELEYMETIMKLNSSNKKSIKETEKMKNLFL